MKEPKFFRDQNEFRTWLQKHHETETELLVGFYKVGSGKESMTWPESVDQALCFGWIDAVRRSLGEESYCIRFTRRKPGSIWSAVNISKVQKLREQGLLQPAGEKAFSFRKEEKSKVYSYENAAVGLDPEYEKIFRKHKKAWAFFSAQSPGYKKLWHHRIMSPKKDETRKARLEKIIAVSEEGKKLL